MDKKINEDTVWVSRENIILGAVSQKFTPDYLLIGLSALILSYFDLILMRLTCH